MLTQQMSDASLGRQTCAGYIPIAERCPLLVLHDILVSEDEYGRGLILNDKNQGLLTVDMVDVYVENIFGIDLADSLQELEMESVVVMDGIVGHYVEGDGVFLLKMEVAMHLLNMWIALQEIHNAFLQLTILAMVTYGIDAHCDDDMILVVEQFGNGPCKAMDAPGRHRLRHADVERTDDGVGTIVVEDDIIDTEHSGKLLHVLHDVVHHVP